MEKKKAVWYLLMAAVCGVLAFNLWFGRPRSPLDIAGLRGQEVVKVWVSSHLGLSNSTEREMEDPQEIQAFLSALDEVRFQEELYFGGVITFEGSRSDDIVMWTAEGYASIDYSSGDGTMVYRGSGSRRSRVFHISGDPAQLKPLFDMADTWPEAENS